MNVLDALPLYKKNEGKGKPDNKLWRALKISGLQETANGKAFQIIPHPSTGITAKQLDRFLAKEEVIGKVSTEVLLTGGWVLLYGKFVGNFYSNKSFTEYWTPVKTKQVEVRTSVAGISINGIQDVQDKTIVQAAGITWEFNEDGPKPTVGDMLIPDQYKGYKVIYKKDIIVKEKAPKQKRPKLKPTYAMAIAIDVLKALGYNDLATTVHDVVVDEFSDFKYNDRSEEVKKTLMGETTSTEETAEMTEEEPAPVETLETVVPEVEALDDDITTADDVETFSVESM